MSTAVLPWEEAAEAQAKLPWEEAAESGARIADRFMASNPSTIPNARIRNLPNPAAGETSPTAALYHGAKTGAELAMIPSALPAAVEAPITTAAGIAGGTVGDVGGKTIAEAAGAGDFGKEVAGDIGGLVGGGVVGGIADATIARARALYNALPEAVQKEVIGVISPRFRNLMRAADELGITKAAVPKADAVFPGASLPATPAPEQLNPALISEARTLPGQISKEVIRPPATTIPARGGLQLPGDVATPVAEPAPQAGGAGSMVESVESPATGAGIPRTLSGESALIQVLGGRDDATLLKIAKSRGLNVTQESQLKAGAANKLLIPKIIGSFSPEELNEVRDQYLENTRFRHVFGDIGDEAWNTMALKSYFPDVKISKTQLARSASALKATPPSESSVSPPSLPPSKAADTDLTKILRDSVKQVKARRLSDLNGTP